MAKKQGHYCKVCGMYKSNESFSGKGHNAHICKKCAALTPEERSKEITLTRLLNLPFHLSSGQKAWLKGLQKDKCREIAETAKAVYAEHFPYAERNERKKQLHINEMIFAVNDELWDEYGDSFDAQITFTLDRKSRLISYTRDDDTDTVELSDNAVGSLSQKSFCSYLKQNESTYGLEYTNKVNIGGGRFARGFVGIASLQRVPPQKNW